MRWFLIVSLAVSSAARADDPQKADELFAAAQKLRDQGRTREACDAFAESLRHNPNAIGTILNIARCAEESGKLASAVRVFTDARDRAREQHLALQQRVAEEHLAALEGRAPHLAIAFAEPPTLDTRLVVGDRTIEIASARDILVDPGTVKIVVSAVGRISYETSIAIAEPEHKTLTIPKLGFPVTVKRTSQTIGKVMLGVGVAAAVTGGIIGISAHSRYRDTVAKCTKIGDNYSCDPAQYSETKAEVTLGDAATGAEVAGAILAGAGAMLWLLVPAHGDEHAIAIYPAIGLDHGGVVATGTF